MADAAIVSKESVELSESHRPGSLPDRFAGESIRIGFVRKVYGLLAIQLAITFGVIALFTLYTPITNSLCTEGILPIGSAGGYGYTQDAGGLQCVECIEVYASCFEGSETTYVERGLTAKDGRPCSANLQDVQSCAAQWKICDIMGGWNGPAAAKYAKATMDDAGLQGQGPTALEGCLITPTGTALTVVSMVVMLFVYCALLCPCCCGADTMRRYPTNMVLLHIFSTTWGIMLGVICAT